MKLTQLVIEYAKDSLGLAYSQSKRDQEGYFDCSSLVYRLYKKAGYTFKTTNTSSTALTYDKGFTLLYPHTYEGLGNKFTSVSEQRINGYTPQEGDVIYYCTDTSTTRNNKITHVVLVENDDYIIHARSTAYGVRRDNIDLYGKKVVAITRLKPIYNIKVSTNTDKEEQNMPYNAICTGGSVNIRKTPNGTIVTVINRNAPLIADTPINGWSKVTTLINNKYVNGYMSANYIKQG